MFLKSIIGRPGIYLNNRTHYAQVHSYVLKCVCVGGGWKSYKRTHTTIKLSKTQKSNQVQIFATTLLQKNELIIATLPSLEDDDI